MLNNLGGLALDSGSLPEARARFRQALLIARETGSPFEEARALEGAGRCDLRAGRSAEGIAPLRSALAIYQHIGSPRGEQVAVLLSTFDA